MRDNAEKSVGRGRPRSGEIHLAILDAAMKQVLEAGFRAFTMDAVAARAGVGKMTVYRRWPNKAALVMDAFLKIVGPETNFPEAENTLTSIKLQMRLQVAFFRSDYGRLIKSLLGEMQFDSEVAEAFRDRWILPRRQMTRGRIEAAIREGALRPDINIEAAIDMLYGPIYYRLQIETGTLEEAFSDLIFEQVMNGLKPIQNPPQRGSSSVRRTQGSSVTLL